MTIGFVLDDGLDRPDGVQQYILTLGSWLVAHGHAVHYLVGQTARTDIPNVHSLSRNVAVRFNQNRLSVPLPAAVAPIERLFKTIHFDVLHVQLPFSPFLAKKIIELAEPTTAIVGTFHIMPSSAIEAVGSRLLAFWLAPVLKRFDTVFSVSAPAQLCASRNFHLASTVLPNVVDTQRFRSGRRLKRLTDQRLNIVFLGRLVRRKGCMYLLQALDVLNRAEALEHTRVVICGGGPLEKQLKQYVQKQGLDKLVEFTGRITEKEKPDYLASADIAVFPSIGGESFGIVLLEAMAADAGVVLAGDNPGYRSVLGDNPMSLVDPTNTIEFASRLQKIIDNPGLRKQLHAWQDMAVQHYDVALIGKKLLRQYAKAIAKRAAS